MRVRVIHPVPIRLVPRTGRHERLAFVASETSAEIPEADPAEFVPVGPGKLRLRGRGLWKDIRDVDGIVGLGRYPDMAAVLVAWLGSEGCSGVSTFDITMLKVTRRSPLMAMETYDPRQGVSALPVRGGTGKPRGGYDPVSDLGDEARTAVVRTLARDYALMGGKVMVRLDPLLAGAKRTGGQGVRALSGFPYEHCRRVIRARFSTLDGPEPPLPEDAKGVEVDPDYTFARGGLARWVDGGCPRRWFANARAQDAHVMAAAMARRHPAGAAPGLEERLRPVAARASIGLADAVDDFAIVLETFRYVLANRVNRAFIGQLQHDVEAGEAMAAPVEAADAMDLAGLAP